MLQLISNILHPFSLCFCGWPFLIKMFAGSNYRAIIIICLTRIPRSPLVQCPDNHHYPLSLTLTAQVPHVSRNITIFILPYLAYFIWHNGPQIPLCTKPKFVTFVFPSLTFKETWAWIRVMFFRDTAASVPQIYKSVALLLGLKIYRNVDSWDQSVTGKSLHCAWSSLVITGEWQTFAKIKRKFHCSQRHYKWGCWVTCAERREAVSIPSVLT